VNDVKKYLQGGDLRSIADVDQLIPLIKTQKTFDELFSCLDSDDRLIVMRAADAIEKITRDHPEYLDSHKIRLIRLLNTARDKELKWHLVLLIPKIDLNNKELGQVWNKLYIWAKDKKGSRIVRVNSLQALYELSEKYRELKKDFEFTAQEVKTEGIPSINARLKMLTRE
jgi:hypothetical protein